MSDPNNQRPPVRRDLGMTLPEVMIAALVFALIVAVLSAGISVTMRQQQDTQSRVDVARWEQNLGMWLPDDLTSASSLNKDAWASPCGNPSCPGVGALQGSNVIQLAWTDGTVTTTVSYRYQPDRAGHYGLYRVACVGSSCRSTRVLGDLSAPMDAMGAPIDWQAGVSEVPANIIEVSAPEVMNASDPDPLRRVTVVVNGVPAEDGTIRSSQVSIAAGGVRLDTLDPPSFTPPRFESSYSECGGPITLVVDNSGSITEAYIDDVQRAVTRFIDTFAGTPTSMQIIKFSNRADLLGPDGAWNHYYDLSDPLQVTDLKGRVGGITLANSTNWEDGLFRASRWSDGRTLAEAGQTVPEIVVLFTDGMPTVDRTSGAAYRSPAPVDTITPDALYTDQSSWSNNLSGISPRAWWRANTVADAMSSRLIGVLVGPESDDSRYMKIVRYDRRNNPIYVDQIIARWPQTKIMHEEFLGDLVAKQGLPSVTTDSAYRIVRHDSRTGWPDVTNADVLQATNFEDSAEALAKIALATCGGTLTVQTRVQTDNSTAPFELTYEAVGKIVTTSRFSKTGTFDVAVGGKPSQTVQLIPRREQLDQAGYRAVAWVCKAQNADMAGVTLIEPADPAAGINIPVASNQSVACTLEVSR